MINADNTQGRALGASGKRDRDGGFIKGGCDVVDRNGVVGVGSRNSLISYIPPKFLGQEHLRIRAHIANNRERPARRGETFDVHERRDFGGKVDAVHEDVGVFDDFLEGTACMLGLDTYANAMQRKMTYPSWSPQCPTG